MGMGAPNSTFWINASIVLNQVPVAKIRARVFQGFPAGSVSARASLSAVRRSRRGAARFTPGVAAGVFVGLGISILVGGCGGPGSPGKAGSVGSEAGSDGHGAAGGAEDSTASPAYFQDRAAATGLDFVHFNGMSGELYLAEITCGGAGLVDFDGDGDLDVYLPQGQMLGPGKTLADASVAPRHPLPLTDRLYRNDLEVRPDGTRVLRFTDVTAEAGLEPAAYGCGVATGDFDDDGRTDLYVTRLGPNTLLRNRGEGTFEDVTRTAGVGEGGSGVPALFVDYDRDGRLDLFVGNNMTFDYGVTLCYSLTGAHDYCGPGAFPSEPDRLYRNLGDGRFEDVTRSAGLAAAPLRPTLGALAADFDGDGWPDLYVANDGQPNNLWINRRDGTFRDQALISGSGVNAAGQSEASMGVASADADADGDLDVFLTHLVKETNTFYLNDGTATFADATAAAGLGPPSLPYTSFGTGFLDLEDDGDLDLLVVNGAVTLVPELVRRGDPFPLHQPDQLFLREGSRWREAGSEAAPALRLPRVSRGAAFGDLDNDGDTDVLVVDLAAPARLLINRAGEDGAPKKGAWTGIRALTSGRDGGALRDALGARVALLRNGEPLRVLRVATDGSYASAGDPRVLFGLGEGAVHDGVRIHWPDGTVEDFPPVAPGRYTTLVQGSGTLVSD
jgi:hypothetical protein